MSVVYECDVNVTCENIVGVYICICNMGFLGDGKICSNIDDCLLDVCKNGG